MNLCICQFHMLIFMTVSTYEDSFFPKEAVQSPEGVWQKAVRFSSWFFLFFFVGLLGIRPVFVYVHTVYWLVYMGKNDNDLTTNTWGIRNLWGKLTLNKHGLHCKFLPKRKRIDCGCWNSDFCPVKSTGVCFRLDSAAACWKLYLVTL